MAVDPLETARKELSAAPLEDWVAERGRLAKALKADGEADAAKQLAKEQKPGAAEWAVGRIADEDPDAVAEWNGSAAALRDASGKKGAGDALREAMAAHRDATESLVDTIGERIEPNGRPLSAAMLERVRELLQDATSDPDGLGGVPPRKPTAKAKPKPEPKQGKQDKAATKPKPDPEAEKRARHRAELERAVAEAEEEAGDLADEADEAETAAKDAETAAQRANSEAREARKASMAKTKELDRLRTRLDRL